MSIPTPRVHGDHGGNAGPDVAAEDLDLALARLSWAESCACVRTTEQCAALGWHAAEVSAAQRRVTELCPDAGPGRGTVLP
jgi:hypothetical protein